MRRAHEHTPELHDALLSGNAAQRRADARCPPNLVVNRVKSAFFASLDSRNRYAVPYRINIVKKTETRNRKIAEFVAMLARGEKIHK